ncbi:MAG: hypothetical protein Q4F85_08635 [Prevotella sp.]|nr:hypothetical protein [Prevotella sp.]
MNPQKRIIINTLAQHIRTTLNILMSLFSTRLILSALGNNDFGTFSLIGSTVAMLGFITNAMVVTTQRHLSFSYGKNNIQNTKKVFANSLFIHILTGLILFAALLAVTPLLFNGFLTIESSRIDTVIKVYILMGAILFITFVTSPFRALFIARENIVYISIIDFIDGVLKLCLAIMLLHINADRLITYALMMTGVTIFNFIAFAAYAKSKFAETVLIPKRQDIKVSYIKELMSFAGWTIYSMGCIIGRTQGMAIVLNRFFGTIINTSYGIASQISGAVQFIAQAVLNAMSPQIIKSEGAKEHSRMLTLSEMTSKYACLMLSVAVIPIIFEMPSILEIWLKEVPDNTVMFCQFILIASIADQTTIGLGIANQAIGKIKVYSLTINTLKIITLPLAWICLKLGLPAISTMWCYLGMEIICAAARLPFLKYTAGLSICHYINNVFIRILPPLAALLVTGWGITTATTFPLRFLVTIALSVAVGAAVIWRFSLTDRERTVALDIIKRKKQ